MLRNESDIQADFRRALRGTLNQVVRPALGAPLPAPASLDAGLGEVAALGAMGLMLSEAVGGIPEAVGEFAVAHAELGRALLNAPILPGQLAALVIERTGAGHLPLGAILAGEMTAVIAGLGEAPSRPRAALAQAGGSLSGQACFVPALPQADLVLLAAATGDGPGDCVLLAFDKATLAGRIDAYRTVDGRSAGDLDCDCLAFSADAIVASGEALALALDEAGRLGCLALAADCAGSMERMIELTASYLQVREQFGKPLATHQALQHSLAEGVTNLEMARAMIDAALDEETAGESTGLGIAAVGRYVTARAAATAERMIQLHGGIGISEEYEIGHHYRRALVSQALARLWAPQDAALSGPD